MGLLWVLYGLLVWGGIMTVVVLMFVDIAEMIKGR